MRCGSGAPKKTAYLLGSTQAVPLAALQAADACLSALGSPSTSAFILPTLPVQRLPTNLPWWRSGHPNVMHSADASFLLLAAHLLNPQGEHLDAQMGHGELRVSLPEGGRITITKARRSHRPEGGCSEGHRLATLQ